MSPVVFDGVGIGGAIIFGIYLIVWGIAALFGIAMYVLRSLSVYTIAKRRGLENPWLCWLPVGFEWMLGSLSDQYKYLSQEKIQSRRKILLGLSITNLVGWLLGIGVMLVSVISAVAEETIGVGFAIAVLLWLVCFGVSIATTVFSYMCKYDLYKSCDPKNAVAYLVISIFINVTEPFFLLACRNKDEGMPQKTEEPQPAPETPAEPVEEPAEEPVEEPEEPAEVTPAALPAAAVIELGPIPEPTEEPTEE